MKFSKNIISIILEHISTCYKQTKIVLRQLIFPRFYQWTPYINPLLCHAFPYIFRYIFVGKKKLFLCLPPCNRLLGISCLSHWQIILPKIVYVLVLWWAVCNPWWLLCPHQWFHWLFWWDRRAVSPVGRVLLNFPGYSWISSVVFPSLDCVRTVMIFLAS